MFAIRDERTEVVRADFDDARTKVEDATGEGTVSGPAYRY
jgi:ATP-dependent 26S proteasome regulatory subunit